MDVFLWVLVQVLDSVLFSLLLYLLQVMVVIGMIGVLLIVICRGGYVIEGCCLYVGVVLGLIYLFNFWFVVCYFQGVVKLYLGFDILLVSGLLGGWCGGLVCLVVVLLVCYQFVGILFFLFVSFEVVLQMVVGVWLCRYLYLCMFNEFLLCMILQVWFVCIGVIVLGLVLGVVIIGVD